MFLPQDAEIGDVYLDYLVIGRCWSRTTRDALLTVAREREIIIGRYRIDQGTIYYDGLNVGRIQAANGGASRWGWKLKTFFTGNFFRPRELGGANLAVADAVFLQKAFEARAFIPEELQDLMRRELQMSQLAHMVPSEANKFAAQQLRSQLAHARLTTPTAPPERCAYTTIDRTDYAVDVILPDTTNIAERWVDMPIDWLPTRWAPKTLVKSFDTTSKRAGDTVYFGTKSSPMEHRGTHPLARVYQYKAPTYNSPPSTYDAAMRRVDEQESARHLRIELEGPSLINVNPDRTRGTIETAQLAGEVLGALLGRGALPTTHCGATPQLAVPIIDLDSPGPAQLLASQEPYLGHAVSELRRLARCGWGNLRNIARIQLTCIDDASVGHISPDTDAVAWAVTQPVMRVEELDDIIGLVTQWRDRLYPGVPVNLALEESDEDQEERDERAEAFRARYLSPGYHDPASEEIAHLDDACIW